MLYRAARAAIEQDLIADHTHVIRGGLPMQRKARVRKIGDPEIAGSSGRPGIWTTSTGTRLTSIARANFTLDD